LFDGFNARIDRGAVQVTRDRRDRVLALFRGGANVLRRLCGGDGRENGKQTSEKGKAAHLYSIMPRKQFPESANAL
jgi:hypothetical protein